jgi:hypothetical protein
MRKNYLLPLRLHRVPLRPWLSALSFPISVSANLPSVLSLHSLRLFYEKAPGVSSLKTIQHIVSDGLEKQDNRAVG